MAIMNYIFESEHLNQNTHLTIIMPEKPRSVKAEDFYRNNHKYKVLWLLHGTYGDPTDWVRKTNIELYATERNLVVVMPTALNSNYSNWNDYMLGYSMFDYLTEELMPLVYGWLPVSPRREDNYIAGLSMGGRGAIKYAASHPGKFAGAAILSAVPMDLTQMRSGHPSMFLNTEDERTRTTLRNAGGLEAYRNSEENVWAILDKKVKSGTLPKLMFACGEEDAILWPLYQEFKAHAEQIGLDAYFFSRPGYRHEWRFWDLAICEALDFFDINDRGGNPF